MRPCNKTQSNVKLMSKLIDYTLHLADTGSGIISSQEQWEWCVMARYWKQISPSPIFHTWSTGQRQEILPSTLQRLSTRDNSCLLPEDSLVYLRVNVEYKNLLLQNCWNGDWAQNRLKRFFFSISIPAVNNYSTAMMNSFRPLQRQRPWRDHISYQTGAANGLSGFEMEQKANRRIKNHWVFGEYTGEFFIPADYELIGVAQQNHTQKSKRNFEEANAWTPLLFTCTQAESRVF